MVCLCLATLAQSATLPTDLAPVVGADSQPVGSDEQAIWQRLDRIEESIRDSPQRMNSPDLDAYTRAVVERLVGRPVPELRIYLIHDASLNAAVLPNGMMIVNTGLLVRVRDEAQLAAVLGHEVGHYFRKHSLDLYRDSRRKSVLTSSAGAALNATYGEGPGPWIQLNHAILLSGFRFSRDLESDADAYGLMLMARAGIRPSAAAEIWGQVVDERRASAAARHASYRDRTSSTLSTHPPTEARMADLTDTAAHYARSREFPPGDRAEWADIIRPYQVPLLREQVNLNDPGASLYLLENLARDGWNGVLRFHEGEVYRLRNAVGDAGKAATAYAAATAFADAPPAAWRAHGIALLQAGRKPEAHEALNRYLELQPDAVDAGAIRFTLTRGLVTPGAPPAPGGEMSVRADPAWEKLPARMSQHRWEDLWTWGGPQIDRTSVVRGLPDGRPLISQPLNAEQRVPVFRADMTWQDLASMVEASYRVNGVTRFGFDTIEPADFLGGPGVRMRYRYVSGIGITKRGDCVMRIVGDKLYAMKLESLANHGFDQVAPEFERLAASARLGKIQ
jgi:predicted Zn-dependent protease